DASHHRTAGTMLHNRRNSAWPQGMQLDTRRRMGAGRAIVLAGASLTALALAAPAQAGCAVEGDTTTCTGDNSGGIFTDTANVIVSGLTTDITSPPEAPGIWMPNLENGVIDLGDHAVNGI